MVDAHALGACGLGRAGSNPASPTIEDDENCRHANSSECWQPAIVARPPRRDFRGRPDRLRAVLTEETD